MVDAVPELTSLPAIPDNGLLLHVGVYKTGTTALQGALARMGADLAERDVLFRGPVSWQWKPLRELFAEDTPGGPFRELEAAVHGHRGRVMISSENLCVAEPDEARRLIERLAGDRPVTVLITARALAGLLGSTWQQFLKRGYKEPYEDWVRNVFANPRSPGLQFWLRNDFPAQVRKWGDVVGEPNVVLAMSDKRHPTRNPELVARLLGLEPASVVIPTDVQMNRSMSFDEAELLRRVNVRVSGEIKPRSYQQLVRLGVFRGLRGATAGDPIPLPRWTAEACAEIGAAMAAELRDTRAVLVGDVDQLGQARWDIDGPIPVPETIALDTAVAAIAAGVLAAERRDRRPRPRPAPAPPARPSLRARLFRR